MAVWLLMWVAANCLAVGILFIGARVLETNYERWGDALVIDQVVTCGDSGGKEEDVVGTELLV